MPEELPAVLIDPIGVMVAYVLQVGPGLEHDIIEAQVRKVAGGRAKQRKLAQALAERPQILTDGRSPAPRALAALLTALRSAGAEGISPPICADCGKQLRTIQRRGDDWYCGACGPRREPCSNCAKTRPVHLRDREGRPRCDKCPLDEPDPTDVIAEVVSAIDPSLPNEAIATAARRAATQSGQRYRLAWALQDRPGLLTGEGAYAPVPSVLRLIDLLCEQGARQIVRPACPHCGRTIPLVKPRAGVRLCRNCVAKSRAEPCSRCGTVKEAATRDDQGRPLCPNCLITDPANQETCTGCDRRRPVSTRTAEGPLCVSCVPWKIMICGICGNEAPAVISQATGQPWCRSCKQRWATCSQCGELAPICGGTQAAPLCARCTRPDEAFWKSCFTCGRADRINAGRCVRCAVEQRLRAEFGDASGRIDPRFDKLFDALTSSTRPTTVDRWLSRSSAPKILRTLDDKDLTHQALDDLPPGKSVEHLRSVLVAIGVLEPRDEQLVRLERWMATAITSRRDPEEQHLLRRYAIWHVLRRLRHRTAAGETTHNQFSTARQQVRAAIVVLDWLATHDLTLTTCTQKDLEAWITSDKATHRREAGHFIRWATAQKLTSLIFPATKWGGPQQVLDTENRWEQARWLLHDDAVKLEDRVAGLLVLLYAQWPSAISRLTLNHLDLHGDQVKLHLGREPLALPEPLASLTAQLAATRRGHAAVGRQETSPWLFAGGQPGRPISAPQLTERLRQIGIQGGRARSTALFQLATDLPAALLARMLGIHISVAVAWQRASAGDWTSYAADLSKRFGPGESMPMTFTDHLREAVIQGLATIPTAQATQTYAISFYLWNEDDDPERPALTLGSNTGTQVQQILDAHRGRRYPDPAEARWNYAYWLQNELAVIGDRSHDLDSATLRDEWIKTVPRESDQSHWVIAAFADACTALARDLHRAGEIEKAIGRPVPILVHELEYYEQVAQLTEAANPPGLAEDFLAWTREQ